MNWTEWVADFAFLFIPPASCVWAWWLWTRQSLSTAIPQWRRVAAAIAQIAFTASILLGAFALEYWRSSPGGNAAPPEATRVTTVLGFALTVFGVPLSLMARSWNRIALVLCSLALLGFYFGMFMAP
jgi:hypothetical protein